MLSKDTHDAYRTAETDSDRQKVFKEYTNFVCMRVIHN
jgi:hypothetical protein